jgi:hypothetical protein
MHNESSITRSFLFSAHFYYAPYQRHACWPVTRAPHFPTEPAPPSLCSGAVRPVVHLHPQQTRKTDVTFNLRVPKVELGKM